MALPAVLPRIRELFQSGFSWVAYMMALVYSSVRLLPAGHPYLNPANMGRYGLRHVVAEAANNLIVKKENIDQIVVFFALLAGFLLLVMQFVLLAAMILIRPAAASSFGGGVSFSGMFATPNPAKDVAFELLDKVFAIPGLFGSQYDPDVIGGIPAFNEGLHVLLQFYSMALLAVAVLIFLYYVLIVVGETAQSGTPFGKRFSHIWAPLRLVTALGLLVPLNYGLNGAQYITLHAAKMGSGFATNAWIGFNETLMNEAGLSDYSLLARPKPPDIVSVVQFMSLARACKEAYEKAEMVPANSVRPYLVKSGSTPGSWQEITPDMEGPSPDWPTALGFYNNGDVVIRFGVQNSGRYGGEKGGVEPYCGEITVPTGDVTQIGARDIQTEYYGLITMLWNYPALVSMAQRAAAVYLQSSRVAPESVTIVCEGAASNRLPADKCKQEIIKEIATSFQDAVYRARDRMIEQTDFSVPQELLDRGWGGAAIWYNRLAMWNGALFSAAINVPTPSKMPRVMGKVQEERKITDKTVDAKYRFRPYLSSGTPVNLPDKELNIASLLSSFYEYWVATETLNKSDTKISGNIFIDVINRIFGTSGLYDLRFNKDIHPMAQLAAIGKSMIESSIRNLCISLGFATAGGALAEILNQHIGASLQAMSGIAATFTMMGLTAGFILFYLLPFMPFLYFFFAVSSWVKAIFEAMVGVPLWALAHLRIDGNGLPGDAAMNGYYLIFEIFLRPILTVFGLLGGMTVFSAMVGTLHEVFPLLTDNLTGFAEDKTRSAGTVLGMNVERQAVDEFFFTVVYTILVYTMALSSFKMIDQIPRSVLKWMGAGVSPFHGDQDPTGNLVGYAAIGGSRLAGEAIGVADKGAALAGQGLGKLLKSRSAGTQTITATGTSRTPGTP